MEKKPKKQKKIIIISIISVLLAIPLIILPVTTIIVYESIFGERYETASWLEFSVEDYVGLQMERSDFQSEDVTLAGYKYSKKNQEVNGVVVIAHGLGGGGHNTYMDCANYFAQNGYYVFAYDATGNDESEGDGVGGMPQGTIDLEHAISFVKQSEEYKNLPIVLFGHSWGGYSVCSALSYHPDVKAVIECSGFNSSAGMFESQGKKEAGDAIYGIMPFVKIYEFIKFGKYATNTSVDGFESSDAAVMILHSEDDAVVPIEYGYDIYEEKFKDNPRFKFIHLEDRGHDYVYYDTSYIEEFNAEFDKWLETLDYDYNSEENKERFTKDKKDYINENLDREKWSNMLDPEIFKQFLDFYDTNIK